jgi:hypothetical protein
MPQTIDVTPTWGEIGKIHFRFAECGEVQAVKAMREEMARAFAMAEALRTIYAELPPELRDRANETIGVELTKWA